MPVTLTRLRILVGVLAVLSSPSLLSAAADGYNRPTGYHESLAWQSSSSSAQGLMFFESSAPGAVSRFLIETPNGRHLVLTSALLVRSGIRREQLRDEESGWEAELTKKVDFVASDLADYFARVYDWKVPGKGRKISMSLRTSNGLSFAASVPLQGRPAAEHQEFSTLLKASLVDNPPEPLPRGVQEALVFLDKAFETTRSDSRGIIEILSSALDLPEDDAGGTWREVESGRVNGLDLTGTPAASFAAKFPSVDPAAPLPAGTVEVLSQEQQSSSPSGS